MPPRLEGRFYRLVDGAVELNECKVVRVTPCDPAGFCAALDAAGARSRDGAAPHVTSVGPATRQLI